MENKKKASLKDFHKKLKIKMIKKENKMKLNSKLGIIRLGGA